ncbi:MAG: glucose-1-phosphate adenylyltransferase [Clostridia bacterium]|nr:glucose-1-phosphate adenylyltransferase [Clostridia bacterium]
MYYKKKCIAMLLAGGQGSRLYALTERTAKPAVGFGGKYKIIDFPLSNCVNSGIDTVGVLTQYQPLALAEHIGNGAPWDLDRTRGGLSVLPPYQGKKHSDWYKGTANAIYQNIDFIKQYDADYVLILSGDHIYKMDYAKMLEYHENQEAVCTVATIEVPIEEASRFGICNTRPDGSIYEFEEKPKEPKNNQASMGIYIFNTDTLLQYLEADEADENSSNDFGKNVIPALLAAGERLFAYPFAGYWKDVGTISSLWEANMDLLGENPVLDLNDTSFRIFSRNYPRAPQFIGDKAVLKNSLITEGCVINGTVENSILFAGVTVEEGAVVKDAVVMEDVTVGSGAKVSYAIVDSDVVIEENATVGVSRGSRSKIVVIPKGEIVKKGEKVK